MSQHVLHVTDETFERDVLQSSEPVLVDFWAEWCEPCRMMAPAIDALGEEYAGRAKIAKADATKAPKAALRYQLNAVPTVMVFDGGQVVGRALGLQSKQQLKQLLEQRLNP
jgi:thioredoxin 1